MATALQARCHRRHPPRRHVRSRGLVGDLLHLLGGAHEDGVAGGLPRVLPREVAIRRRHQVRVSRLVQVHGVQRRPEDMAGQGPHVPAASEAIKTYVQCSYSLTILPSPSDIGAEVHRATPTYSHPLLVVDVGPTRGPSTRGHWRTCARSSACWTSCCASRWLRPHWPAPPSTLKVCWMASSSWLTPLARCSRHWSRSGSTRGARRRRGCTR